MKFYYDIVCPYAYMAFKYLKSQNVFQKHNIELKPILLGGLFKHLNSDQNPNLTMSKAKSDYLKKDILRQAEYFGVNLSFHLRHPVSTVRAMRLIHACPIDQRLEISDSLYNAYWQEGRDIDNEDVIDQIAKEQGLLPTANYYDYAKKSLIEVTKEAFDNKIFGVPSLLIDGSIYFGADRLWLLQKKLSFSLPDFAWSRDETIDFYFDLGSPYSYLAWIEVKHAMKLGVSFNLKPILLGALFKEVGMHAIPMLSAHPHKTEYFYKDMSDWAHLRGASFIFNSNFPLRTVTPIRIALANEETIDPLFAAAWVGNRNIGDDDEVIDILNKASFNGRELLCKANDNAIKERLRQNTAEAVSRGVFGVPTFFVKGEMIFGQDRFPLIRRMMS